LGYERLDDGGVSLVVIEWRVVGFMESDGVPWLGFERLSNSEMACIMDEEGFRFKEFWGVHTNVS
jgi:hypothetical protein